MSDKKSKKVVKFRSHFANTIRDVMKSYPGWVETLGSDWDFIWSGVEWIREHFDSVRFLPHQRVNHFRNHYEISRKDHMVKNIKRMQKALQKAGKPEQHDFSFYPATFVLPKDYSLLVEEYRKSKGDVWIMKPVGRAQGKGIFLFSKISAISAWKRDLHWDPTPKSSDTPTYVCQKYLANPLLVGGRKFDLRIYVLVTSYSPLTVWLCRTGFGRFSYHRYTTDKASLSSVSVHLTNVAIQKKDSAYRDDLAGSKWDLKTVRHYVTNRFGRVQADKLFVEMEKLIIRSLQSVSKIIVQDNHCFELYGYDVLIDADLKPWLIEINASPSLTADTKGDYKLKEAMLHDMITVVDMFGELPADVEEVGCWDLIYDEKKALGGTQGKSDIRPWLIEINASPSLTADTKGDYKLKEAMLHDMITVVDMFGELPADVEEVGCWDLIYDEKKALGGTQGKSDIRVRGREMLDLNCGWIRRGISFLGCDDDRARRLRQLEKKIASSKMK
ncbi:Probable tubulin polyglutamylase TTLL9 [Aduncisulcus paluster]|uniref:Tubulin--tyrosine ligase-like protein 9 n=1 Tax=Aduncisulcus paluster TaxID=2918883 RepID=A0ABQ5JX51_9EUKA|nr:Probable tubulin polyglutamylase TTLL9 [Aduncisulcus paluster]